MKRGGKSWVYLAVGCGAALGSLLRMLTGAAAGFLGLPSVFATGFVNVVGSFVIVFFAVLSGPEGRLPAGAATRQFVMAGLCGGFTTFSAMSLDTFALLTDGEVAAAAL